MAVSGTNLYACGSFSFGNVVHNVASWNGRSWSPLGAGITNSSLTRLQ
jgi:hypothetical protein